MPKTTGGLASIFFTSANGGTPCTTMGMTGINVPLPDTCSAAGPKGIYDQFGLPIYVSDCSVCVNSGYALVSRTLKPVGCSNYIIYNDCVPANSNDDGSCDNDYYSNDNDCISCPNIAEFVDENGHKLSPASGGCGFGTINSGQNEITDCRLFSDSNQDGSGDPCKYCDNSGCFELPSDCVYSM